MFYELKSSMKQEFADVRICHKLTINGIHYRDHYGGHQSDT